MFPVGHIAYSYGAVHVLSRCFAGRFDADYRWLALAALLPDVLDKPLALTVFRDSQTSQGLAHALVVHVIVAAIAWLLWRSRSLPYLLAFSGHLVLDQIWRHPATLFYPFMGWQFDPYKFMGTPQAMASVYWDIFLLPQIWIAEVVGLAVLAFFVVHYQLYRRPGLLCFVRSGRFQQAAGAQACLVRTTVSAAQPGGADRDTAARRQESP